MIVRVENLTKSFQDVTALHAIQLGITAGEKIALIGRNGSGKSTLIRCLIGLHCYEGVIEVFGSDPRRHRKAVLDSVGFVPQIAPPLGIPVNALISFATHLCDVKDHEIGDIADRLKLDLKEVGKRAFRKLSGGMRHKLLIALALARRPKLLILDEPTANLDPDTRQIFLQMCGDLPKETAVIVTSHRVAELEGFINRIVEMDNGKIVKDLPTN